MPIFRVVLAKGVAHFLRDCAILQCSFKMATAMVSLRINILETLSHSRLSGCFYLKLAKYISRYTIFDNNEVSQSFKSRDSNVLTDFNDLAIPPKLLERLTEQNILSPNEVQKKVYYLCSLYAPIYYQ